MTLLHNITCSRLYLNFKYLNSFNILEPTIYMMGSNISVNFIPDDGFLDPKRRFLYIFCYD